MIKRSLYFAFLASEIIWRRQISQKKNLLNKVLSYISIYYRNLIQFKIYPLTSTTYVKTDLLGEDGKTMWVIYTTNISK